MRLTEIEKLTKKELRHRADQAFELAGEKGPAYLSQAEFYTRELDRRADSRTSIRDLILEIVVILLIGGELYMSYNAGIQQDRQFKAQQTVLGNTEQSSKETLAAITAERQTMEAMRLSLDRQVELFYDVQLNIGFDDSSERLLITNTGRGRVSIERMILEGESLQDMKYPNPQVVAPNGVYFISLKGMKDYLKETLAKDGRKQYPFRVLLKNEKQERITVSGNIISVWVGDSISIVSQTNTITPGWIK